MGHPNSSLTLGIPFASSDGRFYSRFPQGNHFSVPGNAVGALPTATTVPPQGQAGGSLSAIDIDFIARATASVRVKYALNFDDVYRNGVLVRKINNKTDLLNEALDYSAGAFSGRPLGERAEDHLTWDTTRKLSGRASLGVITMPGDGANGGSWRCNPSGTSGAAPITRMFAQWSVYYPKETLGYRWRLSGDASQGSAAMKTLNFGQAGGAQVVVYNPRFLGFPSAFLNQSSGNIAENTGDVFASNPWGTTGWHIHNTIDTGKTLSTKADWLERYGPLPRAMDGDLDLTYNPATYLYDRSHPSGRGWPDSAAAINGFQFQLDNWTTFEACLEYNTANPSLSTVMIWAARYGQAPKLIFQGVGNVPLFNNPDNAWDSIELLNYDTQRIAEPGVRPTLFTNYAELIVSEDPIAFPGGYGLHDHLGGVAPTWIPQAVSNGWQVGTWMPISGAAALPFGLSSTNRPRDVKTINKTDSNFIDSTTTWSGAPGFARDMGPYGTFVLGLGGAHSLGGSNYEGNDTFAFDLGTRTWTQIRAAFANYLSQDPDQTFGEYPDGSPTCAHTDSWLCVTQKLPGYPKGMVFSFKSLQNVDDSTVTVALPYGHMLDLNDPTGRGWTRGDAVPNFSTRTEWKDHVAGIWDPRRRRYWLWAMTGPQPGNHFAAFDPLAVAGSRWSDQRPANPNSGHGWSSNGIYQMQWLDRRLDRIFTIDFKNTGTIRYLNPNVPSMFNTNGATAWSITETGTSPTRNGGLAVQWSNWRQAAITWSGSGDAQVNMLKYASGAAGTQGVAGNLTLNWSNLVSAANTVVPAAQGVNNTLVWNRFQICTYAGYEIGIGFTHVDGPVYAFLLAVPTTPKG